MKKNPMRLLGFLLMAMMMVSLFAVGAFAGDTANVAAIGETEYPTLQAAIDAAEAGDTVVLLKDITLGTYVQGKTDAAVLINKPITLDGNGHTLTSKAGRAINVNTTGEVEIKNLTIKQYCGRASNDQKRCINVINQTVTLKVTNCKLGMVEHYASGRTLTSYVAGIQPATGSNHNITVEGCEIATIYGFFTGAADTTINVKDSSISNALYGFWIQSNVTVNVENTTITTKEDMGLNNLGVGILVQAAGVNFVADEKTTINAVGPKENGKVGQAFAMYTGVPMAQLGTIDLSAATVNKCNITDPVIYIAPAQAQLEYADNTIMFDTLDEAIAALTKETEPQLVQLVSLNDTEIDADYVNDQLCDLGRDFYYDAEGEAQLCVVKVVTEGADLVKYYPTIAAAVEAATATEGADTLYLLANHKEAVALFDGMTLDLQSFTLEAETVYGTNGSYITGAVCKGADSGARLIVAKDAIALGQNAPSTGRGYVMPVWDATAGAFVFAELGIGIEEGDFDEGTLGVQFDISGSSYVKQNLLIDQASSGLHIEVVAKWTENGETVEQVARLNDAAIRASVLDNYSVKAYVALEGHENLTIYVRFVTDAGVVVIATDPKTAQ
jgi:hypothetical protein